MDNEELGAAAKKLASDYPEDLTSATSLTGQISNLKVSYLNNFPTPTRGLQSLKIISYH